MKHTQTCNILKLWHNLKTFDIFIDVYVVVRTQDNNIFTITYTSEVTRLVITNLFVKCERLAAVQIYITNIMCFQQLYAL